MHAAAYIYLNNLKYNLENIKKAVKNSKILLAVKANAYGHGAVEISKFVEKEKLVDYLGIADTIEGIELRENGIKLPILKFSQCFEEEAEDLIKNDIETAAYSVNFLKMLNEKAKNLGKKAKIHIKIDTGMGRVGVLPENLEELITELEKLDYLELKGVMTHFPSSDEKDKTFTYKQIEIFKKCVSKIKKRFNNILVHAANSGAILDVPEAYFSMVRPGIMAYGYYPSNETTESVKIKPVMCLVSKIAYIKKVAPKTPISYGRTYKTIEESKIATIPVGYGDGYSRNLSNRGIVNVNGFEFKIAGRVCMDQFMIDLGKNEAQVKEGDEVVLFGEKDGKSVSLNYLCSLLGTIPYEPLCNVAPRVKRIYLNH